MDGFETDSADGPDIGSREKRRFKCLSSAALWGLAPFTEMGITQRWWEQGWGGNEFSSLPARGPAASAKPCPSRGGQAVHPAVGCLQRRKILPRANLDSCLLITSNRAFVLVSLETHGTHLLSSEKVLPNI